MSSNILPVPHLYRDADWVPFTQYTQLSEGISIPSQIETISASRGFVNFSHEELRLMDYKDGRGHHCAEKAATTFNPRVPPFKNEQRIARSSLLCGPGIEICVGTSAPQPDIHNTNTSNTWCLPRTLISHYSPFFKAACQRNFKECNDNRINLPEDEASVFALFVEWIYYGSYTAPSAFTSDSDSMAVIHVKCWVLGDKILCPGFKNFAITCLYKQYTVGFFAKSITPQDVQYVCANSAVGSKLRKLYITLLEAFFGNPCRVVGTMEEWDEVLQKGPDLRLAMLQKARMGTNPQEYFIDEKGFLELDEESLRGLET